MNVSSQGKWLIVCALVLAVCMLLSGCAVVPPQQVGSGLPTQTPEFTKPSETTQTIAPETNGEPDAARQEEDAAPAFALVRQASAVPGSVEIFYSGMASMMGFADTPSTSIYEHTMESLPALVSLLWPNAAVSYYRYSADTTKTAMAYAKDVVLANLGEPHFYRDTPMMAQPERVKRDGEAAANISENMNEPIPSFFDMTGLDAPAAQSGASGTQVAVQASDAAAFTLIVTDLHELRMDDGALLTALSQNSLSTGRTIGLAAISSEFSGYIPDIGANKTAFLWGSPPSGTLDYLLDFSHYQVGVSIDPQARKTASRPFYILVMGEQAAVNAYLEALGERLDREFAGSGTYALRTALFGNAYVNSDYAFVDNVKYAGGRAVSPVTDPNNPGRLTRAELKASTDTRYMEWEMTYPVNAFDPRGNGLTAEDFLFTATAYAGDGSYPLENLTWSIAGATASAITLSLRLEFPQGALAQGNYNLEITGALIAPAQMPGSEWLERMGWNADGAQLYEMELGNLAFDGSRTLFLSRLVDALGKMNLGRLGEASLGSFIVALTVYA